MAISGKGEGKAKGAAKSVPARPASERPVRLVDDLHCDDNMRRAARFTIRASRASRKFLQRSISTARPNSGRFIETDGNVAFLIIVKLEDHHIRPPILGMRREVAISRCIRRTVTLRG